MNKLAGRNRIVLAVMLLSAASISACSTSGSLKTSASNPAPISYKIGNGQMPTQEYASLDNRSMPYVAPAPVYTAPLAAPLKAPSPAPVTLPSPKTFDQAGVDSDLYMHQKVGRPYSIEGKRYTPKHDPSYDQTGIASWYGPNFHGKLTANGETYDKNGLTAAHKTLPLNSNVFVTNLENGKTLMVRLNDRGPFVDGRIIDLSAGAANVLGVTGLSKVRVQYAGPADMGNKAYANLEPVTPKYAAPKVQAPVALAPQVPAPVIEAPKVEAPVKPKQLVEATPQNLPYQPLSVVPHGSSDMRQPAPENVALPQSQAAKPVYDAPNPPYRAKPTGKAQPRQVFTPPSNGGTMTMTITGPIHLASNGNRGYTYADLVDQGGQYVQAATFSSQARANSVRQTLQAAGPVTINMIKRGDKTLHRVLVGPYDSAASAQNALSLVATLGYGDAKLVSMQ